jgi:3-dehydroquinate synthase
VIWIDANEQSKTLSNAERILISLSELGMTKNDSLRVVGGGCVQDIGTLVASLYMRGIEWVFVPTTLAAMGDSCIGGKSSINAGVVKNLVGNFYPPKKVIIDPKFCGTLPPIEVIAGISEMIKICYAKSTNDFRKSLQLASLADLKDLPTELETLILLSLRSKKYFIEVDEFDTGLRKLLNFGHSFGHALESASKYQIPHGVAVMIGMIAASRHTEASETSESEQLRAVCLRFLKQVSSEILDPVKDFNIDDFGSALKRDKKNTAENLVLILPGSEGLSIREFLFSENAIKSAQQAMENARIEVLNEIR